MAIAIIPAWMVTRGTFFWSGRSCWFCCLEAIV